MGWQVAVNVVNLLYVGAVVRLGFDASWWHTSVYPFLAIRALKEENLVLWQIGFETTLFTTKRRLHQLVLRDQPMMLAQIRSVSSTYLGPSDDNLFLMTTSFRIHTKFQAPNGLVVVLGTRARRV